MTGGRAEAATMTAANNGSSGVAQQCRRMVARAGISAQSVARGFRAHCMLGASTWRRVQQLDGLRGGGSECVGAAGSCAPAERVAATERRAADSGTAHRHHGR
jgi:hypothetical protein